MRLPGDAILTPFRQIHSLPGFFGRKKKWETVLESLTRSYIATTDSSLKTEQEVGNTKRTEVCCLKLLEIELLAVANEDV